jgi:hypothetical protein
MATVHIAAPFGLHLPFQARGTFLHSIRRNAQRENAAALAEVFAE